MQEIAASVFLVCSTLCLLPLVSSPVTHLQRWTRKCFLFSLQIRKFLRSIRNHKSANFWGAGVRKYQIRKLLLIYPKSQIRIFLKVSQLATCKSANFLHLFKNIIFLYSTTT